MSARYLEFAMFFRREMERRDIAVRQVYILCDERIPLMSIYQWVYGNRIPTPWQLKFIEQRMDFQTPYKHLMGLDRFGIEKKGRQLDLPGLREAKR